MPQEHHSTPIQLIDMVFPGDANHHGTLFGGVALAHMDKVAFLAASRHGLTPRPRGLRHRLFGKDRFRGACPDRRYGRGDRSRRAGWT